MRNGKTNGITIYQPDYDILKERIKKRPGLSMAGLIHELILKTEPLPRIRGQFAPKGESGG